MPLRINLQAIYKLLCLCYMANGTSPIPFDTSTNVSFTGTPSPVPQIQGQYADLEKGYTGAINAQPTVPQLTSKYNDQFGVPQLQGQLQNDQTTQDNLNTQISMAPRTIAQASQQSILTQGQKDAAVQNLTTPLQQQLATATTDASRTQNALGTAQTNAGNMVTAEQAQQTKQLLPWTQAFSDANVTTAMQMTGWTTENAQQLQVLLANQQAGVTLTKDEQDNLEALAQQEQSFENTLKVNAASSQDSLSNSEALASYNANLKAKATNGTGSSGTVLQAPGNTSSSGTNKATGSTAQKNTSGLAKLGAPDLTNINLSSVTGGNQLVQQPQNNTPWVGSQIRDFWAAPQLNAQPLSQLGIK